MRVCTVLLRAASALRGCHLKSRSLIQISGEETSQFLQGLVTNDVRHLEDVGRESQSVYCHILNNQGRSMYDICLYSLAKNQSCILLECSSSAVQEVAKLMKMYRVKRKIEVRLRSDDLKVWAIYPDVSKECCNEKFVVPEPSFKGEALAVTYSRDPRLKYLGYRFVLAGDKQITDLLANIQVKNDDDEYRSLRHRLGIYEGLEELPKGKCFPLESNCDYMNGVSFHKGCYIGQELTARTYHTGVTRKRVMPLVQDGEELISEGEIKSDGGKSVGKLRACSGRYGLGLLRVKEVLNASSLTVNGKPVRTYLPFWWPTET